MNLDLHTLIVLTLLNFTVTVFAGLFIWRANRPVPGLGHVVSGVTVICAAFGVAFFLRPVLGLFAPWIGNSAMIAGQFTILDGVLQYRSFRRLPVWAAVAIAGPVLIAQTYWIFVQDDRTVRALFLAPFMAAMCLVTAAIMVYRVRRENLVLHSVAATALSVYAGMQLFRAVCLAIPGMANPRMPALCIVALNLCVISCLFALSTATNLRLREQIEKLAFCDPLTNLPNRRKFEEHLDRIRNRPGRSGPPVTLIYVDLDRFKAINDRYGHSSGDFVLQEVASRLKAAAGDHDCLARIGGDEFVLLTERLSSRPAALTLIDELHRCLEKPITIQNSPLYLTVSCGLAIYPEDVTHTADLLREADADMYRMKRHLPSTG